MKILKNYTKIIIPISKPLLDHFEPFDLKPQHLTLEATHKMGFDDKTQLGRTYRLNQKGRINYELPKDGKVKVVFTARSKETFNLFLNDCFIHLFDTKLSFLELDFSFAPSDDAYCFISGNYFMNELESKQNEFSHQVKLSSTEYKTCKWSFHDLIEKLTNDKTPKIKPYNFSCLIVDKLEDENRFLFLGSNVFKTSYKYEANREHITLKTFSNIRFGFSHTGAMLLANLEDDEVTNLFVNETLFYAAKQQYFYLFLLQMHLKVMLLDRLAALDDLANLILENKDKSSNQILINDTSANALSFLIASQLTNPSEIEHINLYNQKLTLAMGNTLLTQSLEKKLSDLRMLSNLYATSLNEKREAEKAIARKKDAIHRLKLEILVFLVTQLIGSFSLFKSIWELTEKSTGVKLLENPWYFLIPGCIVLTFFFAMSMQVYIKMMELKRLKG